MDDVTLRAGAAANSLKIGGDGEQVNTAIRPRVSSSRKKAKDMHERQTDFDLI
jgi:hypothetical protein